MKSYRVWIVLSVLLLAILVIPAIRHHLHAPNPYLLYPTPETESAFLKNYIPNRVVEPFGQNLPSSEAQTTADAAGEEFVTHTREFMWYFVMRSEKWTPLMNALRDDASAQLVGYGARILSQSGNPRDGFYFDYKLGNSLGSLKISPVVITSPSPIHRKVLLSECTADVTAAIEVSEKWFPKEPGTMQISVKDSVR